MKDPILQNQALGQHMLYFDQPRVKSLFETTPDGKRRRIGYADEREGVELLDFGRARFHFYAPDAESVRMHGWVAPCPATLISGGTRTAIGRWNWTMSSPVSITAISTSTASRR